MQKKYSLRALSVVLVIWLSFACDSLDKLTQFHSNYNETVTIPAVIGLNLPFNILTPAIKTNTEEVFEFNETRKNLIEEVNLVELSLEIIDPSDSDFGFLKSIEIYIESDGESEVLIAWKYDIDNSIGSSLVLEVSNEDLTRFVIADEFSLKVTTVTDEIPTKDHEIEIQSRFFVNASILGI